MFLTLAVVYFAVITGAIVKGLSGDLTLLTMLFSGFIFPADFVFVAWRVRGRDMLRITQRRTMMVRVMFGMAGITFFGFCLFAIFRLAKHCPFQSSVLFITLASPLLLSEKVGIYRTVAVIVGLMGIVLLTDPFSQAITPAVLFGLCAALAGAGLSITLRRLGKGDQPVTIAFVHNSCGFIVFGLLLLALPSHFMMPAPDKLFMLMILGVFSSLLQLSFTSAYRYSEAIVVASCAIYKCRWRVFLAFGLLRGANNTPTMWNGGCGFVLYVYYLARIRNLAATGRTKNDKLRRDPMIIRVMGEIEIHCFESTGNAALIGDISALTEIDAPTDADMVNWLGKALDDPAAPSLDDDEGWRKQVEVAAEILAAPALQGAEADDFVLLLVLREKWPVGSKARFKILADRVGSNHTYRLLACPLAKRRRYRR